jgi:hypothetical protein
VGNPPEVRNPMAEAMMWVSRITTIALQMVLPTLAGYYADSYLGTRFLILVGTGIGMALGFWQLLSIAKRNQTGRGEKDSNVDPPTRSKS